jgi:hypothetical protein
MVDIMQSRKPDFLGVEFNEFLFAPIGADASGTPVTVVSALARLDLDPWAEAANLTRLPGAIATQKLAELISRFPEIPSVRVDPSKIAARLTALLPGRSRSETKAPPIPVRNLHPSAKALMAPRFILSILFIAIAILFGTQMVMAQFHPAKTQNSTQTTASTVTPERTPLPEGVNVGKLGTNH